MKKKADENINNNFTYYFSLKTQKLFPNTLHASGLYKQVQILSFYLSDWWVNILII